MKAILVEITGTDRDLQTLAVAGTFAHRFAAHLDCLRVSPDAMTMITYLSYGDIGAYTLAAETLRKFEQRNAERKSAALAEFTRFCAREGIAIAGARPAKGATASWHECTGEPAVELLRAARSHDLTIVPEALARRTIFRQASSDIWLRLRESRSCSFRTQR
jgi:hypothetical protein